LEEKCTLKTSCKFVRLKWLPVSIVVGGAVYVGYLWWRNRGIFYEVKGLVGRR
jgi:hypothetical protein